MSEKPFPLVPQVDYPIDYETDKALSEEMHAAIEAGDLRRQAELHLQHAHRMMVRRDATLAGLVSAVQRGDADGVRFQADLHVFWHTAMEGDVGLAEAERKRLALQEAEAER